MLDKEEFFKEYKVEQEFLCSGLKWEVLEEIYDDYCRRQPEVEEYCSRFAEYFLGWNEDADSFHPYKIQRSKTSD